MSQILKAHLALNTPHFEESVRFYRAFLGLEPVKLKPGYAKFDVAEPPLDLRLPGRPPPRPGAREHHARGRALRRPLAAPQRPAQRRDHAARVGARPSRDD